MGGGKVRIEVSLVALAARMTRWAVSGRQSNSLVFVSASRWAATTGRSTSMVFNLVATSLETPMIPMWYCGAGLGGVRRLVCVQRRNPTRIRLSMQIESGVTVTRADLTKTDWRKAKTFSQSSTMVANVLAVA